MRLVKRLKQRYRLTPAVVLTAVLAEVADFSDDAQDAPWHPAAIGGIDMTLIENLNDEYAAQELPLFPWDTTPKPVFVRIDPRSVSGRRFTAVRAPREA